MEHLTFHNAREEGSQRCTAVERKKYAERDFVTKPHPLHIHLNRVVRRNLVSAFEEVLDAECSVTPRDPIFLDSQELRYELISGRGVTAEALE